MRYLLAVLVLSLYFCVPAHGSVGSEFEYTVWEGREIGSLRIRNWGGDSGELLFNRDTHESAEFCSADSDFLCVFTIRYAFAVPKTLDPQVRSWSVRGFTFEVIQSGLTVLILGNKSPAVATAVGRETSKPTYSLYSPNLGLIAFTFPGVDQSYWLVSKVGFARETGPAD